MQPFFVPNVSNEADLIVFECDDSFDERIESLKYAIQFVYLSIGAWLNAAILWTIWWKNRDAYARNSFFVLFSMDCGVSLTLIVCDVFFVRLLIYVTPLCPYLHTYFTSPLVFFKFIFILIHHSKVCKSLLQSLLVLNRMTCVLLPIQHSATWRTGLRALVPFVVLAPLSVDWNLAVSRHYMMPTYGGFWVNYIKKVEWASQSRFQLLFIVVALVFIVVCTLLTLHTLCTLHKRMRDLERSITIATLINSAGFATLAVFLILFSFFNFNTFVTSIYALNMFAYDFLNVGSPIVMLCVSRSVREHVFSWRDPRHSSMFPVSITAAN